MAVDNILKDDAREEKRKRARMVGDMAEPGISEAFKVKQAVLLSATEAAVMVLRVDVIISCGPTQERR